MSFSSHLINIRSVLLFIKIIIIISALLSKIVILRSVLKVKKSKYWG